MIGFVVDVGVDTVSFDDLAVVEEGIGGEAEDDVKAEIGVCDSRYLSFVINPGRYGYHRGLLLIK